MSLNMEHDWNWEKLGKEIYRIWEYLSSIQHKNLIHIGCCAEFISNNLECTNSRSLKLIPVSYELNKSGRLKESGLGCEYVGFAFLRSPKGTA